MPSWLTNRLAGPVLGALLLMSLAGHAGRWFEVRGLRSDLTAARTAESRAKTDLGLCRANGQVLETGVKLQNAEVDRLKLQGDLDAQKWAAAKAQADAEAAIYRSRAATIANAKPGADHCASASALIDRTLKGERK